jgi:hypothetical protein
VRENALGEALMTRMLPARELGKLGKVIVEPKSQLSLGDMVTSEAARVLHKAKQQRQRKAEKPKPSDDFDFQARSLELPPYKREFMFAVESHQREWRFDFAWLQYKIAVEIEGLVYRRINGELVCMGRHVHPEGFSEDSRKYATAAILGWTVLRFYQGQVKNREAIDFTMRVLAARGWNP